MLPFHGGRRERPATGGKAGRGVGGRFELAAGLPAAAGVCRQLTAEGVKFFVEERGQQLSAAFRGAGVPGDQMLERLRLTLIEDQEPLRPA